MVTAPESTSARSRKPSNPASAAVTLKASDDNSKEPEPASRIVAAAGGEPANASWQTSIIPVTTRTPATAPSRARSITTVVYY